MPDRASGRVARSGEARRTGFSRAASAGTAPGRHDRPRARALPFRLACAAPATQDRGADAAVRYRHAADRRYARRPCVDGRQRALCGGTGAFGGYRGRTDGSRIDRGELMATLGDILGSARRSAATFEIWAEAADPELAEAVKTAAIADGGSLSGYL